MITLSDMRQKEEYDCGIVAVKILLRALGKRLTTEGLISLSASPMDGTDPRAIESLLRKLGLHVLSGEMTWNDLIYCTQTRPVICLITLDNVGHWVVASGIKDGRMHYQDPSEGPCSLGKKKWHDVWRDIDRLGAVYRQWGIAAWRN
jgi:ABC-type bacteriocin/lantibiotic exporter with double-glycine peptidase domain